jgi:hypothetical protein
MSYNSCLAPPSRSGKASRMLFPARPMGYVTDHASVLDAASVREIERLIGE